MKDITSENSGFFVGRPKTSSRGKDCWIRCQPLETKK